MIWSRSFKRHTTLSENNCLAFTFFVCRGSVWKWDLNLFVCAVSEETMASFWEGFVYLVPKSNLVDTEKVLWYEIMHFVSLFRGRWFLCILMLTIFSWRKTKVFWASSGLKSGIQNKHLQVVEQMGEGIWLKHFLLPKVFLRCIPLSCARNRCHQPRNRQRVGGWVVEGLWSIKWWKCDVTSFTETTKHVTCSKKQGKERLLKNPRIFGRSGSSFCPGFDWFLTLRVSFARWHSPAFVTWQKLLVSYQGVLKTPDRTANSRCRFLWQLQPSDGWHCNPEQLPQMKLEVNGSTTHKDDPPKRCCCRSSAESKRL